MGKTVGTVRNLVSFFRVLLLALLNYEKTKSEGYASLSLGTSLLMPLITKKNQWNEAGWECKSLMTIWIFLRVVNKF